MGLALLDDATSACLKYGCKYGDAAENPPNGCGNTYGGAGLKYAGLFFSPRPRLALLLGTARNGLPV